MLSWLLFVFATLVDPLEGGKGIVRLRPIRPKTVYRPGESIEFELRCDRGVTGEVIVFFNPGAADEGGVTHPAQKCPYSRFRLVVPRDFVGGTSAAVLLDLGSEFHGDRFAFEVRSDAVPREFWMRDFSSPLEEPLGNDVCPPLSYSRGQPVPQRIPIYAILADGIRLDLCQEGLASIRTDPAADFPIAIQNGSCKVTPRRAGSFRVTASFRGLTESWVCSAWEDALSPGPALPMTIADFLADPTRLRGHPTDVGNCRLLEHWTTGYCYIYSMRRGGKVSEPTDVRCGELAELRRHMKAAIERGHCDGRPAGKG